MSRFRFKAFEAEHLQSTMKVGTDAVLLAAWVNTANHLTALDIGTGCGVIALILANRSNQLQVKAIDTDAPSIEEAAANFVRSPWTRRMEAIHMSLQQFAEKTTQPFDLIVSNPPWFSNSLRVPDNPRRNNARHDDGLSFDELIAATKKLLSPGGTAAFIIPAADTNRILEKATANNLHVLRMCHVTPRVGLSPNRTMLEISNHHTENPEVSSITIRQHPGEYTHAYKTLTSPFYLDF